MKNKITVILFATLLLVVSVVNIVKPDKVFSETENRYLKTFPKITWKNFKDGTLGKEIDSYINDQFIFRDDWVSLKTNTELLMGKKDNGRVYFGEDNWLFSIDDVFSEEQYIKNISYLNSFIGKVSSSEVDFMLIPSKSTVMNQYLPIYAPVFDEYSLYDRFKSDLMNGHFTDVFEVLGEHSDEEIYFRTDHHWTSLGAFYTYQAYTDNDVTLSMYDPTYLSNLFYGTDYRKANTQKWKADDFIVYSNSKLDHLNIELSNDEQMQFFNNEFLNKTDKYAYYQGGNHGLMKINGLVDNDKSLLIIKDSFANSILHFLAQDYESITVVDLRYFNEGMDSLLDKNEFDNVLFIYNIRNLAEDVNLSKIR